MNWNEWTEINECKWMSEWMTEWINECRNEWITWMNEMEWNELERNKMEMKWNEIEWMNELEWMNEWMNE